MSDNNNMNKLKLLLLKWRIGETLREIVAHFLKHIRSIGWCLYILAGMGICVVFGLNHEWISLIYAAVFFPLVGSGILLLRWMRYMVIEHRNMRVANEQLRSYTVQLQSNLANMTMDASDYPQRVERLEKQRQDLVRQLKDEEGNASGLRLRITEVESNIAVLESENISLDLKAGLPRHDIELTPQEVSAGEVHFYIKVPPSPKEALKYQDPKDYRVVASVQNHPTDSIETLLRWLKEGNIQWAFSNSSRGDIRFIKQDDIPSEHEIYFIGDIHGDIETLKKIVSYIDQDDPDAIVVFMGDLFDRGAMEMEAVCFFLSLVKSRPGKILWIVGNHDAALKKENDSFSSTVSPSSFFEKLNTHPEWKEFGLELIRLIESLPVAAIFPDGLWVSHGAVPHSDVLEEIVDLSALPNRAKTDCVNARLVDQQRKIPNPSSTTHDVGFENVIGFAEIIRKMAGIEIRQLLCAHQHKVTDGVGIAQYRKYFKNVLCHGLYTSSESPVGAGCVFPCIARYRTDKAPMIISFH